MRDEDLAPMDWDTGRRTDLAPEGRTGAEVLKEGFKVFLLSLAILLGVAGIIVVFFFVSIWIACATADF